MTKHATAAALRRGKRAACGQVIRLQVATWESMCSLYLDECRFRRLSDKTIKDKTWWLERFTSDTPPPGALASTYVTGFVSAHKNGATAHKAFTVIAAFCKWLVREGWLTANPCAGLAAPKQPKVLIPLFDPLDVGKLVKAAATSSGFTGTRDAAVIMCSYDTAAFGKMRLVGDTCRSTSRTTTANMLLLGRHRC
jgi:hypothetical protein